MFVNQKLPEEEEVTRLAQMFTEEVDFFTAWRKAIPFILQAVGATSAAILRPTEQGQRLYVEVSYNLSQYAQSVLFNHPIPIEGTLAGKAYRKQQFVIEQMTGETYQKVAQENQILKPLAKEGVAIAPLINDGIVVGVLKLYFEGPPLTNKESLQRLKPLLKALAAEMQHYDSEVAAQDVKLMRHVSQGEWPTPGQSPELSRVLQNIVEVSRKITGAGSTCIFLANWHQRKAIGWAVSGLEGKLVSRMILPLDYSIAGKIILSSQAIALNEHPEQHPDFYSIGMDDQQPQNMCGVPLRGKRRVIGALMASDLPGGITPDILATLYALGEQAVIAIENTQLYKLSQYRLHNLETIQHLQERLLEASSLEEVVQGIIDGILELTEAQNAQVHLYNAYNDTITLAKVQWRSGSSEKPLPIESIVRQVMEELEPVVINNDSQSMLYEDQAGRPWQVQAMAVYPLISKDTTIGAISATYPYAAHRFGEEEQHLLKLLANMAAGAIQTCQAYKKSQEVDKLKDEVIDGISQELRSPLTLFNGYLDLLLEGLFGTLTAEQKHTLELVRSGSDHLLDLLADIMLYSQLEVSSNLILAPIHLPQMAQKVAQEAKLEADGAGCQLLVERPANLPLVNGHERWLRQAFTNLIRNAIKLSPEGSTINIRFQVAPREIVVSVADNGSVIPKEALEHIWERFYRVCKEDNCFDSRGLELAIVKKIVKAHGGRVWAQSEEGKGNTFYFALPRLNAVTAATAKEPIKIEALDEVHSA